jgi:hypothetical protein
MTLSAIKAAALTKGGRALLVTQKHSPLILTIGGVLGGVVSTVLAAKATLKLENEINWISEGLAVADMEKENLTQQEHVKNLAYVYGKGGLHIVKIYGPAITVGAVSIAAIIGGHGIMQRRNAGLMVAYVGLEKAYNQLKKRVEEKYGEDGAEIVIGKLEKQEDGREVLIVEPDGPSPYARFFDEVSTQWKRDADYNRVFLQAQQQMANNLLQARGHVFLNDIYDALGFERTPGGSIVGWVIRKDGGGDNFIDFGLLKPGNERFVNGIERSVFLDFNVDGIIYNLI